MSWRGVLPDPHGHGREARLDAREEDLPQLGRPVVGLDLLGRQRRLDDAELGPGVGQRPREERASGTAGARPAGTAGAQVSASRWSPHVLGAEGSG